jgi:beta-lactamase regulating signal transducer with metallopeptidase domain/tetratricopeptide (TPR) repeat protein
MTRAILGALGESSLRALMAAALIGAVLALLRVRSGSLRHAAWAGVLLTMLALPWLPRLVPSIAVPVPAPGLQTVVDLPMRWEATESSRGRVDAVPSATATQAAPAAPAHPAAAAAPRWPALSRPVLIVAAYSLGLTLLLVRLLVGVHRLRRLNRGSQRVSIDGATVPVYVSDAVSVPLTAGVLRPRVILPGTWSTWPADTLGAVLAHEQAHVRRGDPLVLFLAHLNRCVFWFHPLGWWLERQLARTAEHACDAAAVRTTGCERRYAEVLLELAEAVRSRRGRIAWRGVGIDGAGFLGQRIDRILQGDLLRAVSPTRKALLAIGCTAAIVAAVACRQQVPPPAPLAEDPEVAANIASRNARRVLWEAAGRMTVAEVEAAEAAFDRNPDDFVTLEKLLIFYQNSGQKVLGWNEMVARRRPRLLRMIERHPEHDLAAWRGLLPQIDPVGYERARKIWQAHVERADVSPRVLYNAATFFQVADKPVAERLLLRGRALQPNGPQPRRQNDVYYQGWTERLGALYALAILGSDDDTLGNVPKSLNAAAARGKYAAEVRQNLEESRDGDLLLAAGRYLVQNARQTKVEFDHIALSTTYLERAVALNPNLHDAKRLLQARSDHDRQLALMDQLLVKKLDLIGGEIGRKARAGERLTREERAMIDEIEPRAVAEMSEEYRFSELPRLAEHHYIWAEALAYTDRDIAGADGAYARSKRYAEDLLALAPKFKDDPSYSTAVHRATITLGAHALREGDVRRAVQYLDQAAGIPPSGGAGYMGLQGRLVNYLLDVGERESVARYLERVATSDPEWTKRMLTDAANIRAGRMPMSYQYMKARQ